jgi:septum formation protein
MIELILASKSPRRIELLGKMGVGHFEVVPSGYDEVLDNARDPVEVAIELALGKANEVAARYPDAWVIGSDTIVAKDGVQLEKAVDVDDVKRMLEFLAGGTSSVHTSLALINQRTGTIITDCASTDVYFYPNSPEIEQLRNVYLESGKWQDMAGGYGIQNGAATLIEKIEGDLDTVVGLPTRLLAKLLNSVGINADPVVQ